MKKNIYWLTQFQKDQLSYCTMFPTTLNLELSCPKGKTHFPKDYVYKDETIECLDSDFCLCLAWLDLLSLLFAPSLCLFLYAFFPHVNDCYWY